jgi:hypothetical protein
MKNIDNKIAAMLAGAVAITSMALAIPAMAQTNVPASTQGASQGNHYGQWMGRGNAGGAPGMGMAHGTPPAAVGSVTAINGTTLTVSSHAFVRPASTNGTAPATPPVSTAVTTYTVDASNATVMKNNATSSVSAIAVGDTIVVQGTTSGTTIKATSIRDGAMMRGLGGANGSKANGNDSRVSSTSPRNVPSPIQGNGQPVVAGTISGMSGSTLTVSTKSNVTYTVDASNAKVIQGNSTVSLSSVSVGDSVIIQGTVNSTAVTASSVIDQKAPSQTGTNGSTTAPKKNLGFFGSIGNFFSKIFGF